MSPRYDRIPMSGCLPAFGQHRGYPPRDGWLRKVYLALLQDHSALRRPDATVVLGVGKSMVPAMAFWSQAFGLAARDGRDLVPTDRAHWLLDEEAGADPYLELDTSLWLLHWWLVSAEQCHVPSWRYLFGYSPVSRYSRSELQGHLASAAEAASHKTPARSVLASDIACLVSMYALRDRTATGVEDELSNPFRTLRLLDPEPPTDGAADRSHVVAVRRAAGRRCPDIVQAYASLDFAARTAGRAPGSISLARLASDPLGPGRLLLAGDENLRRAVHRVADRHADLAVVHSGDGQETLAYSCGPTHLAEEVLATAYPALQPEAGRAWAKLAPPPPPRLRHLGPPGHPPRLLRGRVEEEDHPAEQARHDAQRVPRRPLGGGRRVGGRAGGPGHQGVGAHGLLRLLDSQGRQGRHEGRVGCLAQGAADRELMLIPGMYIRSPQERYLHRAERDVRPVLGLGLQEVGRRRYALARLAVPARPVHPRGPGDLKDSPQVGQPVVDAAPARAIARASVLIQ